MPNNFIHVYEFFHFVNVGSNQDDHKMWNSPLNLTAHFFTQDHLSAGSSKMKNLLVWLHIAVRTEHQVCAIVCGFFGRLEHAPRHSSVRNLSCALAETRLCFSCLCAFRENSWFLGRSSFVLFLGGLQPSQLSLVMFTCCQNRLLDPLQVGYNELQTCPLRRHVPVSYGLSRGFFLARTCCTRVFSILVTLHVVPEIFA